MSCARGTRRLLLSCLALALLAPGCQSPATDVTISSKSSLLAVDVRFPAALSRDPSLVQAFLVRGPIHAGMQELPELIPASFVKRSRAYLLDPEPGTYSLVAVSSALAPPWNQEPVAGVTKTRWNGTSADAMILPEELIQRSRTSIGRGSVAFMGTLRVRPGERIRAEAALQDDLQRRIAEHLRPGATSESGLAAWLNRTWTVDPDATSFSDGPGDREAFLDAALADLGASPWAGVVARARPSEAAAAKAPDPVRRRTARSPEAAEPVTPAAGTQPPAGGAQAVKPPAGTPERAGPEPQSPATAPDLAAPAPAPEVAEAPRELTETPAPPAEPGIAAAVPPFPERKPVPGIPRESPLAAVALGMSHYQVRDILGAPDDRVDRTTRKAWIPFYTGPGAYLRDWIYRGEGRVVFSLDDGALEVVDVVHDPEAGR